MELHIEKINVSDNKFLITKLHQSNGAYVKAGDLIYSVESSKSSKDVEAPCDGYLFYADEVKEYEEYTANYLIACIVEENENPFAKVVLTEASTDLSAIEAKDEANLIATKEAYELAAKHGVDLLKIKSSYITKWDVLEYIKLLDYGAYGYNSTIKRIAIIGAGLGAMQVLDLISHLDGYRAVALYDDTPEKQGTFIYGVPVVGGVKFELIAEDYKMGKFDYIVNAISTSNDFRKLCFNRLTGLDVPFCNLIHPSAVIGHYVTMGTGNIILPFTHIGANTKIGDDCFLTANASIEHHNIVGSHCTCGPCVMTSGCVKIGDCVRFGAGIFVEPHVEVGSNSLIASGTILTNNVPENTIVRHLQNIEYTEQRF